ncbi:MAG: hypothetical protein ACRDHZ_07470 [Ktedonobacteraceae bacterium]
MKQIRGTRAKAVVLQMAILALLVAVLPAIAQNNDGTTTGTTTTLLNPNDPLLKGSDLGKPQSTYASGAGQDINLRKDAWTWYWTEKAHVDIDPEDRAHFWGDDAVSNLFKNISNSVVLPFWNSAMEYDFIRAGLLLVVAGMLLGLGATIVMPKKPESK